MNSLPWFKYHVRDFQHDEHVAAMSTLALGAYHRLLWRAWDQNPVGTLPNDDAVLARWAGLAPDEWGKVWSEVGPCFRLVRVASGTRYQQKRMVKEYQAIATATRAKTADARKAARYRWGTKKELHADALRPQCPSNANTESESDQHNNTAGAGPPPAPPASGGVVVVVPAATNADPPGPEPDVAVAARLRGAGVSDAVADDLARTTSPARVAEVIELALRRAARGQIKRDDMAGCVVSAIREGWVTGSPAALAAQPPDERVRAATSSAARTAATRRAEEEQLAAADRREAEQLAAMSPERLAELKAAVLADQPESARELLAKADPLASRSLRVLIVQRLAAS